MISKTNKNVNLKENASNMSNISLIRSNSPVIDKKSVKNESLITARKSFTKELFNNIPHEQKSKIRSQFLNNLITKHIQNPKKMKIREFETHIQENLESVNLIVRNGLISLKRVMNNISLSQNFILKQFYESILLGSLAGMYIGFNPRKRTVKYF